MAVGDGDVFFFFPDSKGNRVGCEKRMERESKDLAGTNPSPPSNEHTNHLSISHPIHAEKPPNLRAVSMAENRN